ncbi:hypothetical protein MQA_02780, partial [Staphylococcus aureus subsp. aureus VRS1]
KYLMIYGWIYMIVEELRDLFKEEDLEPWTSCEFDFYK